MLIALRVESPCATRLNLGPSCSPNNLDLCNDEGKATIVKYFAVPTAELDTIIKEADDKAT